MIQRSLSIYKERRKLKNINSKVKNLNLFLLKDKDNLKKLKNIIDLAEYADELDLVDLLPEYRVFIQDLNKEVFNN